MPTPSPAPGLGVTVDAPRGADVAGSHDPGRLGNGAFDDVARAPAKQFGPRVGPPNARAVLGGSLVAFAMLGTYLLAAGGEADPGAARVVAARDVAPGTVLDVDDLAVTPLHLPDQVDERTFDDVEVLVGSVTLGPVGKGEVVQRGSVMAGGGDADLDPLPQLAVSIEPDRALGGRLRAGEHVDVVATFGSGVDATTDVEATGVTVVAVQGADDGALAAAGRLTVTLALPPDDVLDVAHAAEVGGMRLVRTTGAGRP